MQKIYFSVFVVIAMMCGFLVSSAQESEGGLPWSLVNSNRSNSNSNINNSHQIPTPDFNKAIEEDNNPLNSSGNFRISLNTDADISLNDGTFTYLDNGNIIWNLSLSVQNAKGLVLLYDHFYFPKGVKFFITNNSGKQILGAFAESNNNEYKNFVTGIIQGSVANLELNIDKNVNLNDIVFHINKVQAVYRGIDQLEKDFGEQGMGSVEAKPTIGESASCEIDANCPEGAGYEKAKNATVRIYIPGPGGGGLCSGTLLNNTGNSATGSCKPLLLTASHCDPSNSRNDADYANWIFLFNYEYQNCDHSGPTPSEAHTMLGANFRARANSPSLPSPPNADHAYVADFILVELKNSIPSQYDAYLAGWNRMSGIAFDPYYDFFIGFHHPKGDVKKVSVCHDAVNGDVTFNQNQVPATHWSVNYNQGGIEEGSSGSGLFDKDGLLVGDLSGSPNGTPTTCGDMTSIAYYSKLGYAWENEFDQTTFPEFAGSQSRVKDWLDPIGTGQSTIPTAKYNCSDISGLNEVETELDNAISIYPIPSNTGKINAKINLIKPTQLNIVFYNISGAVVKKFDLGKVSSSNFEFDISDLPAATYYVKFVTPSASIGKKIIFTK